MRLIIPFVLIFASSNAQSVFSIYKNVVNDSVLWQTGHDESTVQLTPLEGSNPVMDEGAGSVVHVKFKVKQYGEVSFSIDGKTGENEEARRVDLSKSHFVRITYLANCELVLQLRQTGVHGGVHNHVTLPASSKFTTVQIAFTEFKGGKSLLDLSDVSKFNFAFLSNSKEANFAELKISSFEIK